MKYAPYPSASTSFAVDVNDPVEPEPTTTTTTQTRRVNVPSYEKTSVTVPASQTSPERHYTKSGNDYIDNTTGQPVSAEMAQALQAMAQRR